LILELFLFFILAQGIRSIQEQQDLIEEQNNRIEALEQLVQDLINK